MEKDADFGFGQALEHLKAGCSVARRYWQHLAPYFLVLVEGREVTVSYEPMKSHVGEGSKMEVEDHIDAIYLPDMESPIEEYRNRSLRCVVDYPLSTTDVFADDWFVWED